MRTVIFSIPADHDGQTVERFLRGRGVSRHVLTLLKSVPNGLCLDGTPVFTTARIRAGAALSLTLPPDRSHDQIRPVPLPLSIVYEDDDLFVVDKPAGMAVIPSQGNRESSLANAMADLYRQRGQPFVFRAIGRLDKDTSGLVVLAKNALSACLLTDLAARGRLSRTYLAVCTGTLPPSGDIDAPIGRVDGSSIARQVRPDGDAALTHFTRLRCANGYSLARVWLSTGRTHQIRVHMAHIGHPLPGDFLYCPDFSRISRHALHAACLTLPQPITGAPLTFSSPLPADMQVFFPDFPKTDEK